MTASCDSFMRVTEDVALAEAKAAERELMAGRRRGPMHGIPYALKDIVETAGILTTGHSKLRQHHVPAADAEIVRRLKAGGGILLGKLATWEFALGGPSFDLPWPPARNPWDSRAPAGRLVERPRRGGRGRALSRRRSAPTPAARSAARRRSAASPGSSRPTAGSAAAASSPTPSRWIMAAR